MFAICVGRKALEKNRWEEHKSCSAQYWMKTKQHNFSRQICAPVWKEKSEEGHQSY